MKDYLTPIVEKYGKYFGIPAHVNVWDVGSRDGDDGLEIAIRISQDPIGMSTVTAIEANPRAASQIKSEHPDIRVIECAVSDTNGDADFIVYRGDAGAAGSSSLDLEWKKKDLVGDIIHVDVFRLDELIGDELIDVMKIDVEGHSLQALKGLGDKIHQIRVFHIETEEWTGSNLRVKSFMDDSGFELVDESQEWPGMPDLTYVNMAMVK